MNIFKRTEEEIDEAVNNGQPSQGSDDKKKDTPEERMKESRSDYEKIVSVFQSACRSKRLAKYRLRAIVTPNLETRIMSEQIALPIVRIINNTITIDDPRGLGIFMQHQDTREIMFRLMSSKPKKLFRVPEKHFFDTYQIHKKRDPAIG